jgi:hypothetical protein
MTELTKEGSKRKPDRALKPDAQPFDEVRIFTVPRFKTSGMSGNEWRISATVEFYRKRKKVAEYEGLRDVETAVRLLDSLWLRALDDGKGYFAGEGEVCDQEGCSQPAEVTYRLKKRYCSEPYVHDGTPYPDHDVVIRKFCARHSKRGDSDFSDCDDNYELIAGQPAEVKKQDESPAAFGGVIGWTSKECGIPSGEKEP